MYICHTYFDCFFFVIVKYIPIFRCTRNKVFKLKKNNLWFGGNFQLGDPFFERIHPSGGGSDYLVVPSFCMDDPSIWMIPSSWGSICREDSLIWGSSMDPPIYIHSSGGSRHLEDLITWRIHSSGVSFHMEHHSI